MNLFLEKNYSAAIETFKENVELLERDLQNAITSGDESSQSTLENGISVLYCNIALTEYGIIIASITA